MIEFQNRLKELRVENNMKQKDLAKMLSVDQRSISNWEKGIREPSFEILIKIAKLYNVSTDYLLGLED